MSSVVLDASAVLAMINQEPGRLVVAAAAADAAMSTVNVVEVVSKLLDAGYAEPIAWSDVDAFQFDVLPFDEPQARIAGALRPITRPRGLSLGDRACLALAYTLGVPVLTADRAWAELDLGIDVQVIR